MTHGRKVCNTLKEIRRKIADKNEIEYSTPDCHFEGECKGTCPQCESEVRYLENELQKRTQLGKAVAVAGIALGMAGTFSAFDMPKQNESMSKSEETRLLNGEANATIKGKVLEEGSKMPLENAVVRLKQGDTLVLGTRTNAKGEFSLTPIPAGKYDLIVSYPTCPSDTLKSIEIRENEVKIVKDIKMTRGTLPNIIISGRVNNDFIIEPKKLEDFKKTANSAEEFFLDSIPESDRTMERTIMQGRIVPTIIGGIREFDADFFDIGKTKWKQEKGVLIRVW